MEVRLDNLSKHFTSGNRPVVKAVDEMNLPFLTANWLVYLDHLVVASRQHYT